MTEMRGWWITKNKIIPVIDHLDYLVKSCKEYEQVKGQREKILAAAMRNKGWVRVRGHDNYITIEFWEWDLDTCFLIHKFIKKEKLWDSEMIMLSYLQKNMYHDLTVGEFKNIKAMQKYQLNPKSKKFKWESLKHEDILHYRKRK